MELLTQGVGTPIVPAVGRLADRLRCMKHGDHYCLIYESQAEQNAAIVPFFGEGVRRRDACVYITDERTAEEVHAALFQGGIDVQEAIRTGALSFATKRDAYLRSGSFDPQAMIEYLGQSVKDAVGKGFAGLRATGEMTWALGPEPGNDLLITYEAMLNHFFPGRAAMAICQYNRQRFRPEIIRDVLRTHPIAILGEQVCSSLYYEPPELMLGETNAERRLNWMLSQLRLYRDVEERLEQAVAIRDEFLSVASHELNTPLTSLMLQLSSTQHLLKAGANVPPERLNRALGALDRQVQRLRRLVSDLLDVSRIHAGRLTLHLEKVDLVEVANATIDKLSMPSEQAGVRLVLDAPVPVHGVWDGDRLEQVAVNLVSNALKHGRGSQVLVQVRCEGGCARLVVTDDGPGIAREDQERIFRRFERSADRNVAGLGLGLFIAREIVQAHGGWISVQSELGRGATFVVELPLNGH